MKKHLTLIGFMTALFIAVVGCSEQNIPQEGVKYTVVKTPTPDAASVVEVFSLGCGHCRNMEKMLPDIQKLAGVNIEQVHVTFNQGAQVAAYMYYTAFIQTDGKPSPELKEDLFRFIQEDSTALSEDERQTALNAIFNKYKLQSPFQLSESQREEVYQHLTQANQLEANAGITSVPTFLVKGKYLVQNSEHESLEDLANTIRYLSEKQ